MLLNVSMLCRKYCGAATLVTALDRRPRRYMLATLGAALLNLIISVDPLINICYAVMCRVKNSYYYFWFVFSSQLYVAGRLRAAIWRNVIIITKLGCPMHVWQLVYLRFT
jgi:hypothetical protein